jgi:hypothetical protein
MRLPFTTLLVKAFLFASSGALADPPEQPAPPPPQPGPSDVAYARRRGPEPPASPWDLAGLRGFEIQGLGGVAYGGDSSPLQAPNVYPAQTQKLNPAGTILYPAGGNATGTSFNPYAYDPFAFAFFVGYRALAAWSFGAFLSYANYGTNADSNGNFADGTWGLERVRISGGLYARYYVTTWSSRLQPWAEVGVGYVDDSASYSHPIGFGVSNGGGQDNGNYLISYRGITVPIGIGLDWRLAPVFAVGPFVLYEEAFPLGGCVQITVDQAIGAVGPVNTCSGGVVQTRPYGSLFGGIQAKLTFDLLRR